MSFIRLLIRTSLPVFLTACLASLLTGLCSTLLIKSIHGAVQTEVLVLRDFIFQFLFFWISYGVFSIIASYSVSSLTQRIIHKLRIDFSYQILEGTFESVEANQSRLLPILTEDIKTIAISMDRLPGVTTGLATVVGILVYITWFSPILSVSSVFLVLLVYLFSRISLPFVKRYADKSRKHLDDMFKQFEGLVFGIKELTLNGKFKSSFINNKIIPTSELQNKYFLRENIATAIVNRSTDMILLFGMGGLIVFVFNTGFVSLDYLGKFLMLILFTLAPLATISGFMSNLKRIEVALNHVEQTGIDIQKQPGAPVSLDDQEWQGETSLLHLENIRHRYENSARDHKFELGPIHLSVRKGEIVFLAGGNGSGKTTLGKIITGLYHPCAGTITYKDILIDQHNLSDFRSRFGAVFLNAYVFDHLLHIDRELLNRRGDSLLATFELQHLVEIREGHFTTALLSDGQKRRLALIMSILEDKEIYLFDEWAANQDSHFKEVYYTRILPELKRAGKTIIAITHDENYFHIADRIIKLIDGKAVEGQ